MPRSVQAAGGLHVLKGRITTPDTLTACFEFERCPVVWRHRIWGAAEWSPDTNNAALFYGEKETVVVADDRWTVVPRDGGERRVFEAKTDVLTAHVGEFLEAVRSRKPPSCPLDDAARSTACVQLAMIAYKTGSQVTWDEARSDIGGPPAAAALSKREYRAPYRHPAA
jgi:hypothetical protein